MNRTVLSLLTAVSTGAVLEAAPAAAQEKRFDAQVFRPYAGPREKGAPSDEHQEDGPARPRHITTE
jgi:hypothetical protein